ncbi:nucleoside monophosphate kinase [Candidatus Falkowbacteria bacterium]|nr:nucleoside monophosphate kinase [Candidatus Falkowbacteria bacterium]
MKKVIILLGPPGSGKGTQADLLKKKLGLDYISTGVLIRELLKKNSCDKLSQEIRKRYNAGVPQPDDLILALVEKKMRRLALRRGIIFDAFPLSSGQAKALEKILNKFKLPAAMAIYIDLPLAAAIKRLGQRKSCAKCNLIFRLGMKGYASGICPACGLPLIVREDDQPLVIKRRFNEYKKRLRLVASFYRKTRRIIFINGVKPPDKIFKEILKKI